MIGECDCCRSENVETEVFARGPGETERQANLCALCAGTAAGMWDAYPHQHGTELEIVRTICFVGNALLAAIREGKRDA